MVSSDSAAGAGWGLGMPPGVTRAARSSIVPWNRFAVRYADAGDVRLGTIVSAPAAEFDVEVHLDFDTSEAAGWWTDSNTGERVFPDRVTELNSTFGVRMADGYAHLAREMVRRLVEWCADGSLIAMTSAPGKWTLLHCPLHAAGEMVVLPRSSASSTE
jgi:hypothetical protein